MNLFLKVAFLFLVGSFIGWVMELFFRRMISNKEWINPGFLVGPCLPIYGFGICTFYLISGIQLSDFWIIVIMALTVTFIEYIGGLIFIKGMGIKLWDYSKNFGNIQGLICPLYTIIWGILGAIYYYIAHPIVIGILPILDNNTLLTFIIGFFYGIMVVDLVYSAQLVVKIRKFAKEKGLIVKYEEFKSSILQYAEKHKEKYSFVFAISNNVKKIEEHLNEYKNLQIERTNEIKNTIKDKVKSISKNDEGDKNI